MNDDSRKDSVVGGALKIAGAGTAIYGAHRGLTSKALTEYADSGKFGSGVLGGYQKHSKKGIDAVKGFGKDIWDSWAGNDGITLGTGDKTTKSKRFTRNNPNAAKTPDVTPASTPTVSTAPSAQTSSFIDKSGVTPSGHEVSGAVSDTARKSRIGTGEGRLSGKKLSTTKPSNFIHKSGVTPSGLEVSGAIKAGARKSHIGKGTSRAVKALTKAL